MPAPRRRSNAPANSRRARSSAWPSPTESQLAQFLHYRPHELQGLPLPKDINGGLRAPASSARCRRRLDQLLTLRLRAEITAKQAVNKAFGFWFPADGNQGFGEQGYVLHLRTASPSSSRKPPAENP